MWGNSFNNGMHWRDIPDRALRSEAEDRAWRIYPNMEDAEYDHDGTIETNFGSTGATITLRKFDEESFGLFGYGYCALLAWAVHQQTGFPLAVFSAPDADESNWSGHAAVMIGEDQFLDFGGVHTDAYIHEKYRNQLAPGYRIVSAEEFAQLIVEDEYRHDPLSFVEDLERFIVEDFAAFIVRHYKVSVPVR
jgi:hypothetical protein